MDLGLTVEQADAVMSAFGIPKTGLFGLIDLVGLDLIPHILNSMKLSLPKKMAFQQVNQLPKFMQNVILKVIRVGRAMGAFYPFLTRTCKRIH